RTDSCAAEKFAERVSVRLRFEKSSEAYTLVSMFRGIFFEGFEETAAGAGDDLPASGGGFLPVQGRGPDGGKDFPGRAGGGDRRRPRGNGPGKSRGQSGVRKGYQSGDCPKAEGRSGGGRGSGGDE